MLLALHSLNTNSFYLDSLLNFQPNLDLEFSMDSFRSTFLGMSHLLVDGPSNMVFEHL